MSDADVPAVTLFDWSLDRTMLVEASAGTGKTWTIAGLYVRQLIEAGVDVEKLLVVTYTEAATKELRGRIRRRLVALREALEHGHSEDAFCRSMLETIDDGRRAGLVVERAISGFDQAAIHTIHGFCQRVLMESAFESGVAFDAEVLTSEAELLQEICDDFWRQVVLREPRPLVEELVDRSITPETLAQWVGGGAVRPYLSVIGPEPDALEQGEALQQALGDAYREVRTLWLEDSEKIADLLVNADSLNRNKYRRASVARWLEEMAEMLQDANPHRRRFERFGKFSVEELKEGSLKGKDPPVHAFFDACSRLAAIDAVMEESMDAWMARMRTELRSFVLDNLAERKAARRWHSFDDLLGMLLDALRGPMGESLARTLRERYRAAMIDEFQDTDPVQLEIFERIYSTSRVSRVFVGDPKQSIYSFRGADLFAYLKGRKQAAETQSLAVNYRSDPALVHAVNRIFSRCENPFIYRELDFHAVNGVAENADRLVDDDDSGAKLVFRFLAREESGSGRGVFNKTDATSIICRDVANRIVALLAPATGTPARLDGRALGGGDVAVLVRTHIQARQIHQALSAAGVASVRQGGGSVFHTDEAEALEQVLRAVVEPAREDGVRTALVSDLFALNADGLLRECSNSERWDAVIERFRNYQLLWREHGFMSMLRRLLADEDIHGKLLGRENGERAMTNILHLSELLQAHEHQGDGSQDGLVKWLSRMRAAEGGDEEAELRLESDAGRVKIVTMHRSKGLEYPVVFCPFLWDGKLRSRKHGEVLFHDPEHGNRATIDLGSPRQELHREIALREEFAESVRLAYVALTRAAQRCYVYWGAIRDAGTSPLAWLLHLGSRVADDDWTIDRLGPLFAGLDDDTLRGELEALDRPAPGAIRVEAIDGEQGLRVPHGRTAASAELRARAFERSLADSWRVTSFSRIVGSAAVAEADRDALVHEASDPEGDGDPTIESPREEAEMSIHRYPRGARTGLCWHSLFEHLDFSDLDHDRLHQAVMNQLSLAGIDRSWAPATESMIRHTLAVDLDPPNAMRLGDVPRTRRLAEAGFFFSVSTLRGESLVSTLEKADSVFAAEYAESVERFRFEPVNGFVRGFIDLVFEHGGRYYLLDYKSNYLGPGSASYAPARLCEAMRREGYFLQYLLYGVALHRYLGARLPDYDCARHFGGVYYLFLRGIDSDSRDQPGIFFDRPPAELIERLDHMLDGGR